MRFVLNLQFLRRVNMGMRFNLNILFMNMKLIHIFRIPHLKGIMVVILYIQMVSSLPHKGRGIPNLGRQIIKVLRSEAVSMNEFFDGIFKSKRKYSYALPRKLRSLSLFKRQLIYQITESGWMP